MGIHNRVGPIYFYSPASKAYQDNYTAIFNKTTKTMSTSENQTETPEVTPEVKRKPGRPKGSKNKPKDPNAPVTPRKSKAAPATTPEVVPAVETAEGSIGTNEVVQG